MERTVVLEVGVFVTLAASTNLAIAFASLVVAGAATLALVSTVMTMLQIVLPAWIRGRGVAIYLLALQGSFAVGAFFWGAVAQRAGLETTLFVAAAAMGVGAVICSFFHLRDYVGSTTDVGDLAWEPVTTTSVYDDDGPILITARWQIDKAARQPFMTAMPAVGQSLKRQGALSWNLSEDVSNPGAMLESFTLATWSEYQRLPERATVTGEQVELALLETVGTQPADLVAYRVLDLRESHAN
jgi:MFS family permease